MPPERLHNQPGKVLLNILIKKLARYPNGKDILFDGEGLYGLKKHCHSSRADIFSQNVQALLPEGLGCQRLGLHTHSAKPGMKGRTTNHNSKKAATTATMTKRTVRSALFPWKGTRVTRVGLSLPPAEAGGFFKMVSQSSS
jgi:hypothetical protein